MAGMLLMPTLTAFMRAYPEVEIDLDFSDRMVDVIEEGFDAVVRSGEIGDSRLMTRQLGTFHPISSHHPTTSKDMGSRRRLRISNNTTACTIAFPRRASSSPGRWCRTAPKPTSMCR